MACGAPRDPGISLQYWRRAYIFKHHGESLLPEVHQEIVIHHGSIGKVHTQRLQNLVIASSAPTDCLLFQQSVPVSTVEVVLRLVVASSD